MIFRQLPELIESVKSLKFKFTVLLLQKHMKNRCSRGPPKNLAWSRPYLVRALSTKTLIPTTLLWREDCS